MNETLETEVVDEAKETTEEEAAPLTTEEMKKLLKEYTNNKSIIEVPVGSEGEKANVEVVHTVTLGDIYIMALLTILVITTLLTRLIGRR